MVESGGSVEPRSHDGIRQEADNAVACVLADLAAARLEENKWCAARVHAAYDVLDVRLGAEMTLDDLEAGLGHHGRAVRAAESEVMAALKVSKTGARTHLDVGEALYHRLPLVDADFTAGLLDYQRVAAIVRVLSHAGTDIVAAIEPEVLAAAHRCTPGRLKAQIWSIWREHDPVGADAARKKADDDEHKVYARRTDDGGSELVARLSHISVAEADTVLDDLAKTVCDRDPRTHRQLRCDAFTAVFRRQTALECRCDRGTECAVFGATAANPPRPGVLLNVFADLPTVLGLLSDRPRLADGTPLDFETAQWLLTNARFRGLLVELLDLARQEFPDRFADDGTPLSSTEPTATEPTAKSASAPVTRTPDHASRVRPRSSVRVVRRRTRARPPLDDPPPRPVAAAFGLRLPRPTGRERDIALVVQNLLERIDANPAVALGVDPSGHAGLSSPPPGALTYRPRDEIAACVQAIYPSCVFAGCLVPAAQCELDHVVPFSHENPRGGGWKVLGNLVPLCKNHHQAKTEIAWSLAILDHGFVCWTTRSGLIRITAPEIVLGTDGIERRTTSPPSAPTQTPPVTPPSDAQLPQDIHAETRWERLHPDWVPEPYPDTRLENIARQTDPDRRRYLEEQRLIRLEHDRVVQARADAEPVPF